MNITAELDSLDATKELVQSGHSRGVLPLGAVHREVRAGRLVARRFDHAEMQALLVLATPLHKPVTGLRPPSSSWSRVKSGDPWKTGCWEE